MDQVTEYLILQEAEWGRIVNNLKSIIPNAQKVFLKPSKKTLKLIGKKLKGKRLKDIERDAIRRIPGFKKDFMEAHKKVPRLKFVTAYTSRGIALATALVSSVTGRDVNDVIKKGAMGVRNSKVLPGPGITQLVTFGLFVTFIISIFISDGAVILPAIQTALYAIGLAVMIIGQLVQAILLIGKMFLFPSAQAPASDYFPGMKDQEGYDPSTEPGIMDFIMNRDPLNYFPMS